MSFLILCIGRLKERYFREACGEYQKRLSRFCALEIFECESRAEPKNASPKDYQKILEAEGQSLLSQMKPRDHVIALCVDGKEMASDAFALKISELEDRSAGRILFVIGGSRGLSREVLLRANERISFSRMTFPHQMARILLLEQLYRAKKMLAGETYHK